MSERLIDLDAEDATSRMLSEMCAKLNAANKQAAYLVEQLAAVTRERDELKDRAAKANANAASADSCLNRACADLISVTRERDELQAQLEAAAQSQQKIADDMTALVKYEAERRDALLVRIAELEAGK